MAPVCRRQVFVRDPVATLLTDAETDPLLMQPRSRRKTIAIGLVGAGPIWERRYRHAVRSLADRLDIRAVYDAVLGRAQTLAAELDAEAVHGMRQLFERTDLKGILVLDPAWYDLFPAELACRYHKPAFLAGALGNDLAALETLHQSAVAHGTLLMTEFSLRHTPATSRLQELMATHLGRAQRIAIEAILPEPNASPAALPGQATRTELLVGLLDWCTYVTGRTPISIRSRATANECAVDVGFRPDASGRAVSGASIRLRSAITANDSGEVSHTARHEVQCERGAAVIDRQDLIAWRNGTGECRESLSAERSDAERMLDQFCRRLHGGLVPVADVHDAWRAISLARAAEFSLETGQVATGPWSVGG
uniref:Gfo/Idh/MocA family oxidoreductase n=1 Tax=Schlesneria paludicola TaxID=360056 RepID=A0A7C2K049_9PLAN